MLDDVVEELHRHVFEHHVDVCLGRDDRVEFDDMGMSQ